MKLFSVYKAVALGILLTFAVLIPNKVVQAQSSSYYCTAICAFAWSPTEMNVLGIVNQYGLWLYNTDDPYSESRLFPYENAYQLSFDPTGTTIAVAACMDFAETSKCNSSLALFNITTQTWEMLAQYEAAIDNLKFSPDGKYVAFERNTYGVLGQTLQLISLATRETIVINEFDYTLYMLDYVFDSQSTRIAITSGTPDLSPHAFNGISVWRLSDQKLEAATPFGILAPALTFTADGTKIVFAEYDTQLSVWDTRSGVITEREQLVETLRDNLNTLRFTDDSSYLVASLLENGSLDNRQLFVWTTSGAEVFRLDTPTDRWLNLIAINPAGTYVAFSDAVDERMLVEVRELSSGAIRQLSLVPS